MAFLSKKISLSHPIVPLTLPKSFIDTNYGTDIDAKTPSLIDKVRNVSRVDVLAATVLFWAAVFFFDDMYAIDNLNNL